MKTVQLRRFFNVKGGTTPSTSESSYWGGSIPWVTPADLSTDGIDYVSDSNSKVTIKGLKENNLLLSEKGWVVFSNRAPIGKVAICGTPLCTNQGCKLIYPNNEKQYNTKYLAYWLISNKAKLNLLGSGTTFNEISTSTLLSFRIPLVDIHQQNKIVDLLDRRVKNIDDVIKEKTIQLEKLSEYRQSLITQAVTKGLDPNVEMKDSGVEWIGHIPQSWSVPQVKYLFSVVCGATPSPSESNWGGDIAWIGPSDMEDAGMIDHGARFLTSIGYKSCGTELVPVGSLILSTRAPIGKVAYACRELCTNQGCKSLVPRQNIETKYFYYVLQAMRSLLEKEGSGTTFMELSTSSLGSQKLPLPSNKEQIAIADYLDKKLKQLQITLDTTKKSIDRLTEYRTSLISAAVTGKIDINEVK